MQIQASFHPDFGTLAFGTLERTNLHEAHHGTELVTEENRIMTSCGLPKLFEFKLF